jgi:hypothetical protein
VRIDPDLPEDGGSFGESPPFCGVALGGVSYFGWLLFGEPELPWSPLERSPFWSPLG